MMGSNLAIVDDAAFIRTLLRKMLEEEGYVVVGEGANGFDAIELVKKYKPDIMVLDITMPDMDGMTALKEIKNTSEKTKIIVCSAIKQNEVMKDALKSGASDFIVKPFTKSTVIEAIKNAMLGK